MPLLSLNPNSLFALFHVMQHTGLVDSDLLPALTAHMPGALAARCGHVAPHQLLGTLHSATLLVARLTALRRARWAAAK